MRYVTIDFETYYDADFTLRDLSIVEYVRDSRFKVHGMGVIVHEGDLENVVLRKWVPGPYVADVLEALDISSAVCLTFHSQFDGFILSEVYGAHPIAFLDGLAMARAAMHLPTYNLGSVLQHMGSPIRKGNELGESKGLRELPPVVEDRLASYCLNDCDATAWIIKKLLPQFSQFEIELIDRNTRLYTEPIIRVDVSQAELELEVLKNDKVDLLFRSGATEKDLRSDEKFAALLVQAGIPEADLPKKVSPKTQKVRYAFAKTDQGLLALQEHPSPMVQALVQARLGTKTTIMETRLQRFINIGQTGPLPAYYRYATAQTQRFGGGDKTNLQNMGGGSALRNVLRAPDGYEFVVFDSKNIELRLNMAFCGQKDAVELLRAGGDLYCDTASALYQRLIRNIPEEQAERKLGKIVELACGYGMGAEKLGNTLLTAGIDYHKLPMTLLTIIYGYRAKRFKVSSMWDTCGSLIPRMAKHQFATFSDACDVYCKDGNVHLPGPHMPLLYPDLSIHTLDTGEREWQYRKKGSSGGDVKLYGGKLLENIIQGLARNVVFFQLVQIAREFKWALHSHDEGAFIVPVDKVRDCIEYGTYVMGQSPEWWPSVPLGSSCGHGVTYGAAK